MTAAHLARFLALGLALLLAACAEMPKILQPEAAPPKPAAPQITESSLRERAQAQLAAGVRQYETGEFENANRSLTGALEHGLLSKADQARARKLLAFIHCVAGREAPCRDEFRKAFEIYPDFALTAAEDGHPIWGPVYRNVRTQLIAEREAAQARPTNILPLSKAQQTLREGMIKYDAGEYPAAEKLLRAAIEAGLADKADKVRAMKHLAFSLCLQRRWGEGRQVFIDIYDVEPDFDLTPAEAGHPEWRQTFAGAKAQAKRELAAKAAREAKEKSAAPKKN